jgi:hypothetical protein
VECTHNTILHNLVLCFRVRVLACFVCACYRRVRNTFYGILFPFFCQTPPKKERVLSLSRRPPATLQHGRADPRPHARARHVSRAMGCSWARATCWSTRSRSESCSRPRARRINLAGPPSTEPRESLCRVHLLCSGSLGFSLSGNRFEVALVGRFRLLVTDMPILKPWEAILSPVVLAAPIPAGDVSVARHRGRCIATRPSASVVALSGPSVRSIPAP